MKKLAIICCVLTMFILSSCSDNSTAAPSSVPASGEETSSTFKFETRRGEALAKNMPQELLDKLKNFTVRDYDNDKTAEAFAIVGELVPDKYEYYYGSLYFVTENTAIKILDESFAFKHPIVIKVKGQLLISYVTVDFNGSEHGYIYKVKDNEAVRLPINGAFRELDLDDTIIFRNTDNDLTTNPDGTNGVETTRKNYWFYWSAGELYEFPAKEITAEQLLTFTGGQGVMDAITEESGTISNILQRENNHLEVNYTVNGENGVLNNFYHSFLINEDNVLEEIASGAGHYKASIQ